MSRIGSDADVFVTVTAMPAAIKAAAGIGDERFEFVASCAEAFACFGVERIEEAITAEAETSPASHAVGCVNHIGHRIGWV